MVPEIYLKLEQGRQLPIGQEVVTDIKFKDNSYCRQKSKGYLTIVMTTIGK